MAQLTITLDDAHVSRVREAFGAHLSLIPGTPATTEQVRMALVNYLKRVTLEYEQERDALAARGTATPVSAS